MTSVILLLLSSISFYLVLLSDITIPSPFLSMPSIMKENMTSPGQGWEESEKSTTLEEC